MIKFFLTRAAQCLFATVLLIVLIVIDTAEMLVMWPFWLRNRVMRDKG